MSTAARLRPLQGDLVDDLPARCRRCTFWELGSSRPDASVDDASTEDEGARSSAVAKQAWVTGRCLDSGPPGVAATIGGRTVGYALYAPAREFAARAPGVPSPSADALLLATAWLAPEARSTGVGRAIVQAAVKDALRLRLRAVEAYGDRRAREWDCTLPATWLLHEGFEVSAEHARYPLLRLDVHRAVRWSRSFEHAVGELLGRTPRAAPVPGTLATRRPHDPASRSSP